MHTIISNNTFKVTICDLKNKDRNIPQTAELFSDSLSDSIVPQVAEQFEKRQQPVDDFNLLFSIPWDHHSRTVRNTTI